MTLSCLQMWHSKTFQSISHFYHLLLFFTSEPMMYPIDYLVKHQIEFKPSLYSQIKILISVTSLPIHHLTLSVTSPLWEILKFLYPYDMGKLWYIMFGWSNMLHLSFTSSFEKHTDHWTKITETVWSCILLIFCWLLYLSLVASKLKQTLVVHL